MHAGPGLSAEGLRPTGAGLAGEGSTEPTARPPAVDAAELAARLRRWRRWRGWNVDHLARMAGVSRTTVFHLERADCQRPRTSTLARLAGALGCSIEDLLAPTIDGPQRIPAEAPPRSVPSPAGRHPPGPLPVGEQFAWDWQTNPRVQELALAEPWRFQDWSSTDWETLTSQFGVGGGLTEDGVRAAAERIQLQRELEQRLRLILQTHLAPTAAAVIDALYQQIALIPVDSAAPHSSEPG